GRQQTRALVGQYRAQGGRAESDDPQEEGAAAPPLEHDEPQRHQDAGEDERERPLGAHVRPAHAGRAGPARARVGRGSGHHLSSWTCAVQSSRRAGRNPSPSGYAVGSTAPIRNPGGRPSTSATSRSASSSTVVHAAASPSALAASI